MYNNVPTYILDALKGESVDFIVQSARNFVKRKVGIILIAGLSAFCWIFLFPLMFSFPLIELLVTGKTQITVNGTLQTYTAANPWGAILFALFAILPSMVIMIPYLLVFKYAIRLIHTKGAWYAGTNKSLIEFNDKATNYYLWNEFESTIQTKTNKDNSLDIILTHKKVSDKSNKSNSDLISTIQSMNITVNGKPFDLQTLASNRGFFMNKIGILGIKNGSLILNMIKHNMHRVPIT